MSGPFAWPRRRRPPAPPRHLTSGGYHILT
jgi:hypothetical protein